MLETDFAELMPYLAIVFVGSGSEHYGFDDEFSRDHDYEPGFCIFLPGEDVIDRRRAFRLSVHMPTFRRSTASRRVRRSPQSEGTGTGSSEQLIFTRKWSVHALL